jgi:hypothetical protein
VAFDAKWSNYGQYLQQLIETVQIQWDRILIQSRSIRPGHHREREVPPRQQGRQVTEIISVNPRNARPTRPPAPVSARSPLRAPYGDWTDDMVRCSVSQQELTFTFYYQ